MLNTCVLMRKLRKGCLKRKGYCLMSYLRHKTIVLLGVQACLLSSLTAQDNQALKTAPESTQKVDSTNSKGYVINFTNVSIIEYIRFISRISNTNFLFQDSDLQFTVTIVSEEPTSVDDIMAALIQILRIHGLSLSEQGKSLLIYKNADIAKLATVISDDSDNSNLPPMITRVIRIAYVSPEKIKNIVQPMLSSQAIVEVSPETRHIIITDNTANIEKVLQLLKSLDVPNSSINVATFFPQNGASGSLLMLAEKILAPIAASEGSLVTLVQQPSTNTIFIVGNSDIVHRAESILEALDQPGTVLEEHVASSSTEATTPTIRAEVASYTALNMPPAALLSLAEKILNPVAQAEGIPFSLVLQPSTKSIFISSTPGFNKRTLDVLQVLDQANPEPQRIVAELPVSDIQSTNFYLYKLQNQNGDKIQSALHTIGQTLQQAGGLNTDLINTLNDLVWIPDTNSLLFAGTDASVEKIRDIMKQIDTPSRQVYIEVLVIATSLKNSLNFGVQWGGRVQTTRGFNLAGGNFTPGSTPSSFSNQFQVPPTVGTPALPSIPLVGGFNLGSVGNFISHNGHVFGTLGSLLTALQTEQDTKVISNPKIIAEDNRQAQVFVGQNIPFTTTNVTIQAANQSTGFTVDYRDVGVLLQVTPILGTSNMVTLEIHQEINQVDPAQSLTISGFPVPTTDKTLTTTRVHVPDGFFVVISGMIQNVKIYQRTGLPCLGCLPYIGGAFSQQEQVNTKQNIILFLHPRIIDTPDEIGRITDCEGCEFYKNSQPEPCDPDLQINRYYKDFFGPCSE